MSRASKIGTIMETSGGLSSEGVLSYEKLIQVIQAVNSKIPPKWAKANFSLKMILNAKAVTKGVKAKIVIMIEKLTPAKAE